MIKIDVPASKINNHICLNMIVKNESHVMERLLKSVAPVIDYFVIVDTGSVDNTIEVIKKIVQDLKLPGEIHSRDWVNFGYNRQEALDLALRAKKGDWLLLIDADEELIINSIDFFEQLQKGVTYDLEKKSGSLSYFMPSLIDITETQWKWVGPVHECLEVAGPIERFKTDAAYIKAHVGEGGRSLGKSAKEKYLADARLLEQDLLINPGNTRNQFYLAQSYRDAEEYQLAYDHYQKRVDLSGWDQEVFISLFEKANLSYKLGHAHHQIVRNYLEAYEFRPSRLEALWALTKYCRETKHFHLGYLIGKVGVDMPLPEDILFIQKDVYTWQMLDEFSVCAYWAGKFDESCQAIQKILIEKKYPLFEEERLNKNLNFALEKINLKGSL